MPRSIILLSWLLLALLSFRGLAEAQATDNKKLKPAFPPDIRFDEEPAVTGSGSGKFPFSDDEDFGESGSGSGSGQGDLNTGDVQTLPTAKVTTIESTTATTKAPLSACEHMQKTSLMLGHQAVPNCVDDVYASTQCAGRPGNSECWCGDKIGKMIPGTAMDPPHIPDCDNGSNMSPCLYQLVTAFRMELLGSPKPQCTSEGLFHPVQCTGSVCYCVDKETGITDQTTLVHRPEIPNCGGDDMDKETDTNEAIIPPLIDSSEDKDDTIKLEPDENKTTDTFDSEDEDKDEDNFNIDNNFNNIDNNFNNIDNNVDNNNDNIKLGGDESEENTIDQGIDESIETDRLHDKETKIEAANRIMSQPGLLAGVIGGSVVLALCLVLLIMFVIYRMRKKDEGSYPLEEPRKPPKYPYMRAPEREFYA